MDYLLELGIGGIFALFLVREFLAYTAKNKKKDCSTEDERFRQLEKKIERLYEMHQVFDENGAPIWYRKKLTEIRVDKTYHVLNNLQQSQLAIYELIKKISEKI